MTIQQKDIRQIVHRLFTIACHSGGDPFEKESFDQGLFEVRKILEEAKAPLQSERVAEILYGYEPAPDELLRQVQDYLPHNYNTRRATRRIEGDDQDAHWIQVFGFDDAGWTLDGYVIPRLASGLIVAREVKR